MSLRKKTFLLTGLALIAMVGVMHLVATRVFVTGYATAELAEMDKDMALAQELLRQRTDTLDAQCHDWSSWDDTYVFARDANRRYAADNLTFDAIAVLKVNLVVVLDLSGRVVYGEWFDLERSRTMPLPADFVHKALASGSKLLDHPRLDQGQRGLLDSPWGLLMVVSRPILQSSAKGPSRGTLLFGRTLVAGGLDPIQRATGLQAQVIPCLAEPLSPNLQAVHSQLAKPGSVVSQVEGEDIVASYTVLPDVWGQHAALLRVVEDREVFHRGLRGVRLTLAPTMLFGAALGILILLILERLVLARVAKLSSDVAAVGAAGDFSGRVSLPGNDELSDLAARINDTLAALTHSQTQLQEREAQYRDLVETTPDKIWQADENGVYTYVSPGVRQMLGYEPEELVGRRPFDLMPPEESAAMVELFHGLAQRREPFVRVENTWLHADGRRVVVETSGVPILDASGAFRGYRGMDRDITDRNRAEERRQAIIQTAMDGFWLADVQGRFLEVNETYCRMSGYSAPELLAMRISDLEATEGDDGTAAHIEKIMAQGEDRFESQHRRKDGTVFDVAVSVQYRPDEVGGLVAFVQDITARKQAEEALRQARDDWESTFNSLTDMVTIHDKDYNIIRANDAARQTLGPLPAGGLAGAKCFNKYHGAARPPVGCPSCRSLETGEPCLVEAFEPHLNKHLEIRAIPRFDADHQCVGLVHIVRDITERKQQEKALAESRRQLQDREAQYRDLVETTPDWIWETDANKTYTYVSPKVRDMLGYEPAEMLGKTPFELMRPEDGARVATLLGPIVARHEAFARVESTWLHADGHAVVVETSGVPIFDAAGEWRGYRGADRDITDRKLAEEALQSRTALLEAQTNATTDGILVVDTNQRRVLTNQRWLELFDIPAHIAADRNDAPMLAHVLGLVKDPEAFAARVKDLYDHPSETGNEEVEFKNGMILERYSAPVLGKDGRYYGRIWHFRDITERKQREEALAASRRQLQEREAQYRDLVETTPDWIWETDANVAYTYVSPKVRDTLGYEPAEVLGKTAFELMPPEEAVRVAELLAPITARHEAFVRVENTCLHADGHAVVVETSAVPILDAAGEFRGYRGTDRDITDRKLAEEALRESNAILTTQQEAAMDGILVMGPDAKILSSNQRFADMWGVPAEVLATRSGEAVMRALAGHLADPEQFLAGVQCLHADPALSSQEEMLLADGRVFERHSAPMVGDDGTHYGRVCYFRDITERKQAERQAARLSVLKEDLLRSSTLGEKLQSITDAVVDAMDADFARVWITNPGDRCRSGCPHAELTEGPHVCRHRDRCLHLMASSGRYTHLDGEVHARVPFGCYKIGRVAAGEDEKFITNDVTHDPRVHNHDWAAELGLASFAGYRLVSLDGEHIGVLALFSKRPIGANEDAVLQQIADTTSHVIRAAKAEEALAAEKERLRVTLRSVGDAVISTDTDGRVSLVSKIAERMTGWTEAEALGLPITEVVRLMHHGTRETLPVPIAGVLATRQIASLTNHAVLVSRDGAEYLIANSAAPIFDQESRLIGAVLVFRDVTTETQLREEANKAQRLESVGLLAGGIAHDFNNLLTVIMGGVQMAQIMSEDTERQTKLLKSAQAACVRAADLTQRLLTFAKGGAPVKQVCSLEPIVRETVEFALTGSAVTLELFVDPDLSPVEIDAGQISQVIQNLVINAVQAMPTGGSLHVTLENRPAGRPQGANGLAGPHVALVVRDEGTGIPPEHLTHVFDPYFTTKQQGSGLGLAAAYAIVTQHEGDLSATSQVGVGSVFTVCLPCAPDGVQAAAPGASSRSLTRGSGRILVMDDEHTVRDVAALTLGEMGYDVETAAHGEAALEAYVRAAEEQRPFDLVMLDLTVRGGMGGQETIQRLLEIDPQVRAIVCSGYSADQVMRHHREHGFQACVVKPFDIRELARTVHQVMADGAN